jgi:hypothetical protein
MFLEVGGRRRRNKGVVAETNLKVDELIRKLLAYLAHRRTPLLLRGWRDEISVSFTQLEVYKRSLCGLSEHYSPSWQGDY